MTLRTRSMAVVRTDVQGLTCQVLASGPAQAQLPPRVATPHVQHAVAAHSRTVMGPWGLGEKEWVKVRVGLRCLGDAGAAECTCAKLAPVVGVMQLVDTTALRMAK